MSIWEFNAATGGYAKANGASEGALNTDEASALASWIDEPPIWH